MSYFPIVPLCEEQLKLRKVNRNDIIYDLEGNGIAKYGYPGPRAGGLYDHFREVFQSRYGTDTGDTHMIIQLRGCTAECPWCYLTSNGVWNRPVSHSPKSLISIAKGVNEKRKEEGKSSMDVLHIIGGAPALYLPIWVEFFEEMLKAGTNYVFHSGFLLNEGLYSRGVLWNLRSLSSPIEGPHSDDVEISARQLHIIALKPFAPLTRLQLENLESLVWASIPFYFVFTGFTEEQAEERKQQIINAGFGKRLFNDAVIIPREAYEDAPKGDQRCRMIVDINNGFKTNMR